jgi:hypothetical protein
MVFHHNMSHAWFLKVLFLDLESQNRFVPQ